MKKDRINLKGTTPDPNKRLNEDNLLDWLSLIYPNTSDWCKDIKLRSPDGRIISGKLRPDYWSPSLRLIVEFDGIQHYTMSAHKQDAGIRDLIAKQAGFSIIHVPFFLQMNEITVKNLFNTTLPFYSTLKNGYFFKEGKSILDFDEGGINLLAYNLEKFPLELRKNVIDSFRTFLDYKGNPVLPKRLSLIIGDVEYKPSNWIIKENWLGGFFNENSRFKKEM